MRLTQQQRDQAIRWFNSLTGHFGQTYIILLTPRGLVEIDPPHTASILAHGGTARITNEDGFLSWLYHTYTSEIEAHQINHAKKGGEPMSEEPIRYFLTVEWCQDGQRGVFCDVQGRSFPKDGEPHTDPEIREILGPFALILDPASQPFTEEEVAEYTVFRPLAEYSDQYGIALKEEVSP